MSDWIWRSCFGHEGVKCTGSGHEVEGRLKKMSVMKCEDFSHPHSTARRNTFPCLIRNTGGPSHGKPGWELFEWAYSRQCERRLFASPSRGCGMTQGRFAWPEWCDRRSPCETVTSPSKRSGTVRKDAAQREQESVRKRFLNETSIEIQTVR